MSKFYFLEIAARVGGALTSLTLWKAASGINLWREWARLEIGAGKEVFMRCRRRERTMPG